MGKCKIKNLDRVKLCSGDLSNRISIEERQLTPPVLGESSPIETFIVIKSVWAGVQTVRGTRRFYGVNIENAATHLFFIRNNPELPLLDGDNYFVLFKNRYFRILRVTDNDEEEYFTILQCVERGEESKTASTA